MRDVVVVLAAAWLVRALVIASWPASAHSDDLDSWITVAKTLRSGANPYVATDIVKWPPFAIVLVWLIDHVARGVGVSFFFVMRLTLIAAESVLVVVLYVLMTRFAPGRTVRRVLLAGISLNPIAILFVCQHENIDVFVGLCVAVALLALVAYMRSGDPLLWLAGCLALGCGAFVKTTPLILVPLLVPGFRAASRLGRALGITLFLGPIVLSLAIAFALAPHAVYRNVILYRSISGYFGVTGFLGLAGHAGWSDAYGKVFLVALFVTVVVLVRAAWRHGLDERRSVLVAALLLAAVPALGPGYAPQYAYWFLPALVASYVMLDGRWRVILAGCFVVGAVDYVVEYGLLRPFGRFLVAFFPGSGSLAHLSDRLGGAAAQTELRVPLLVAFVVLLVAGGRRVWPVAETVRAHRASPEPAREL